MLMVSDEHARDKYKLSFLVTIQLPLLIIASWNQSHINALGIKDSRFYKDIVW